MRGRHLLTLAGAGFAFVCLWRSFHRVEVVGPSMRPTLEPGDRLVVLSPPFGRCPWPEPGAIVALRDPRRQGRVLVKRVAAVDRRAGSIEVAGDDPSTSTDSRNFGPVPRSSIVGRVIYRYGPATRSGPIRPPTEYHRP